MATVLFDLQLSVTSPGQTRGLSDESKNKLFRRPEISDKKPKLAGTVSRNAADEAPESDLLELEDLSEGYAELIERADNILERIKERLSDLTYTFDENEESVLSEALGRVFQNSSNTITYNMYLAALRLDKDIAVEIGESESGFVR